MRSKAVVVQERRVFVFPLTELDQPWMPVDLDNGLVGGRN